MATWSDVWRLFGFRLDWPNIQGKAITVTGTEAKLVGTVALQQRSVLYVFNNSSVTVYLGPTGVTTATGFPLLPNDYMPLDTNADVYAIAASGSNNVRILEVGRA